MTLSTSVIDRAADTAPFSDAVNAKARKRLIILRDADDFCLTESVQGR